MLIVAERLSDLSFGKLMAVYREGNLENGQENWPEEPEARQIALAEQDFYQYLSEIFFRTSGAAYLIWEDQGKYISALRLEPYRDGLLLEALETLPEKRRNGYAAKLVLAALEYAGRQNVYSHVSRKNVPSLRTHEKCGFQKILNHAVYADGSVNSRCVTFCSGK